MEKYLYIFSKYSIHFKHLKHVLVHKTARLATKMTVILQNRQVRRYESAAYKKGRLDVSLPFSVQFYAAVLSSQLRKSVPCSGDTSSDPSGSVGSVGSVSPAGTQLPFSS